ncbi:MAG: hypothetical protein LBB60_10600 [Desulfovibrio sp.]|jgi:hypothetical protein|nr:hypothetical protein [Desulfovibrio sp.]
MPKIFPDLHSFIGGLLSPTLEGRVDFAKYGVGLRICRNFIVPPTGGIYKRPGMRFVAHSKQSSGIRLVPFDFNGTEKQSYILELGNTGYVRFFSQNGQVVDGAGNPLELPCPLLNGLDLTKLNYVQSADVIYFAHPLMQTWKLERLSATSWAYQPMSFLQSAAPDNLPWTEGNWPSKVRIYEDRLIYAATPKQPLNVWMSRLANYNDFRINTAKESTDPPLAEDAIFLRINGSRVNPIMWMLDMEQLVIGTNASEIRIQGRDLDSPLTPETAGHKRQSSYGSNSVQAILLGSSAMFCSRTGVNIYTLDYQDFGYRFKSAPLNLLSQEATQAGVVEMHSMAEPEPIAWCILADGTLAGCTYIRDQQIYAWHQHRTDGQIKSGAIIPHPEGDQLWVFVLRNGVGCIEYLDTPFDLQSEDATFGTFVDSHLTGVAENDGMSFGMTHLVGRTVQVMADGSYLGDFVVNADGRILSDKIKAGMWLVAGLPYTAIAQPMRVSYPMAQGQGVNFKKRVIGLVLRCLGSINGEVRAEYEQDEPLVGYLGEYGEWQKIISFPHGAVGGNPPPCTTENKRITLSGNSTYDGLITVRQREPFPLYIVSISYEIEQGKP